jgi:hypothetical protein
MTSYTNCKAGDVQSVILHRGDEGSDTASAFSAAPRAAPCRLRYSGEPCGTATSGCDFWHGFAGSGIVHGSRQIASSRSRAGPDYRSAAVESG